MLSMEFGMQGQANLKAAVAGILSFTDPKSGKQYSLDKQVATLKVPQSLWKLAQIYFNIS